jgi:hypothetical protein
MIPKLLYLNWKLFLHRLNNLQVVLLAGYLLFLGIMLVNLTGAAFLVLYPHQLPVAELDLAWLNPDTHRVILLSFAAVFWLLHFSFTSTRLLNFEENRKLLSFGYSCKPLARHLNLIAFFHPVNVIYNMTWMVFLGLQVQTAWNLPLVLTAVLLNYGVIYSVKHRFLGIIEKRFRMVVFCLAFVLIGVGTVLAVLSRHTQTFLGEIAVRLTEISQLLAWLPGGLLYRSATADFTPLTSLGWSAVLLTAALWVWRDHQAKTAEALKRPRTGKVTVHASRLWSILQTWLGHNAGKYYYYVMTHPYNKLQILAIALIPIVYIPLLLVADMGAISMVLIMIVLAAIPVALLGIVMANMFGYENREFLLHMQLPVPIARQIKERFLGAVAIPLILFYGITIIELLFFPGLGSVFSIYTANTFFFLCFMIVFLWSSFYHYQKATYGTFSYKHPIIPQKVTFTMLGAVFILGYTIFVPLGEWHSHRLWVMTLLILAITIYIWRNFDLLAGAFKHRILGKLWRDF